jgi:hypothetical protein
MKKTKTKSKPTTVAKSPEGEGLGASPVRKSSVNLNDTVRFKITPTGWQYIGKVNATDPIYSRYPMRFKVDERGFSEAQLWSVMQFFGPAISLGGMPPIETEIYFPNAEVSDPTEEGSLH